MHLLAYNPDLAIERSAVPPHEVAITARIPWPPELASLPNPGRVEPPCHGNSGGWKKRPNGGGYWVGDKYYAIRLHLHRDKPHVYLDTPLERTRCQAKRGNGEDCGHWSGVSQDENGKWYSEPCCPTHLRNRSATLGNASLYPNIGPNLQKHINNVLENPDASTLTQENALVKTMLNKVLENIAGKPDAWQSIADMGAVIAITEKISKISKTSAEIDALRENHLNYKQVLLLLSACIEHMLRRFGKSEDAKTLLVNMLGDLPWPTGVAKVNGAEGLVGKRGELILPARPAEKPPMSIEVEWGTLQHSYATQKPTALPDAFGRAAPLTDTGGLRGDQFAPAVILEQEPKLEF